MLNKSDTMATPVAVLFASPARSPGMMDMDGVAGGFSMEDEMASIMSELLMDAKTNKEVVAGMEDLCRRRAQMLRYVESRCLIMEPKTKQDIFLKKRNPEHIHNALDESVAFHGELSMGLSARNESVVM